MKIKYFADTDTAYIEFDDQPIHESMPIGDDVVLDLDVNGRLVALTLEHAQSRSNLAELTIVNIVAAHSVKAST